MRSASSRPGLPLPLLPNEEAVSRLPIALVVGGALLFAGIYTDIPVALGQGTAPMVSAWPGLLILLCWRGTWSLRFPIFVMLPALAFFALSLLAPDSLSSLPLRLNALAQFIYALTIGYVGSNVLLRLGRPRVHVILSWLLPMFCILIGLEIFTPFKEVVARYLDAYPREYDFSAMADREANMGGYRPKLFTSETSLVGMSSVILIVSYLWSGAGLRTYVLTLLYIAILAALIRSPIVLLALPVVLLTSVCDRTAGKLRFLYGPILLLLATMLGAVLMSTGSEIMESRLSKISSGEDYSTTYRTYGALAVGWNVASEYPLFGIGPGSLDAAKSIIMETQLSLGVPIDAVERNWRISINNAPGSLLVYFGFLGAFFSVCTMALFVCANVSPSRLPVASALGFLAATTGSVYTPKFTATFILLVALAKLRQGAQDRYLGGRSEQPAWMRRTQVASPHIRFGAAVREI